MFREKLSVKSAQNIYMFPSWYMQESLDKAKAPFMAENRRDYGTNRQTSSSGDLDALGLPTGYNNLLEEAQDEHMPPARCRKRRPAKPKVAAGGAAQK